MNKAVVLLSAGLDSTVNLHQSTKIAKQVIAVNFDYGQKAAPAERRQAKKICQILKVELIEIDLDFFKYFNTSSLTNSEKSISLDVDIFDESAIVESARNVWVPNRNGILLNIAAAIAEGREFDTVVPGFNAEEATTFPDNSPAYLEALEKSFYFSTANHVQTRCFTTRMNKTEIVRMGKQLEVDFSLLWPCYQNLEKICGKCESCLRFQNAMEHA